MTKTPINHHPSAELLLAYSAGAVTTSQALCIATHLEFCPSCRQQHRRNNAIGGTLVETLSDSKVSADTKASVMAMLDQSPEQTATVDSKTETTLAADPAASFPDKDVPRSLKSLVPKGFRQLRWKLATLSVSNHSLFADEQGTAVSLLRIKPGGKVSKHRHLGDEYTVIIKGSFSDEDGIYQAGDFLLRDAREQHTPVATKDAECICLTAQEAPLQFTRGLMRLFNPFLRKDFHTV